MTSNSQPPNRRKFEELVAVLVAFLSIGSIFYWVVTRQNDGLDWASFLKKAPTSQISPQPTVAAVPGLGASSPPSAEAQRKSSPKTVTDSFSPQAIKPSASVSPDPHSMTSGSGVPTDRLTVPFPQPTLTSPQTGAAQPSSPTATPPIAKTSISFSDLPPDYWAAPFILELGKKGVLEGTSGKFQPDQPVTRAEFAAMLQKAFFDRSRVRSTISFSDVQPDYWALSAINETVQLGFMNGYPDGDFRPNDKISKLEGLIALVSGLQLNGQSKTNVTQLFQDGQKIPYWATEKVATATDAGLVVNHPNPKQLNPQQTMTRAGAAALIHQALVNQGEAQPIASSYIVKP